MTTEKMIHGLMDGTVGKESLKQEDWKKISGYKPC